MATRVYNEIASALTEAINSLKEDYAGSSLTDIYMVVDKDSGELSVYDDEQNLLSQIIIESWIEQEDDSRIVKALGEVVRQFNEDGRFDSLDTYKPFSVSFADENFIVQEELLVIEDDSIIRIENDFMERIDKEFDDFLNKLLNE